MQLASPQAAHLCQRALMPASGQHRLSLWWSVRVGPVAWLSLPSLPCLRKSSTSSYAYGPGRGVSLFVKCLFEVFARFSV